MSAYILPNSRLSKRNVNSNGRISMSSDCCSSRVTNLVDELISTRAYRQGLCAQFSVHGFVPDLFRLNCVQLLIPSGVSPRALGVDK
jgi:hypothetical protein